MTGQMLLLKAKLVGKFLEFRPSDVRNRCEISVKRTGSLNQKFILEQSNLFQVHRTLKLHNSNLRPLIALLQKLQTELDKENEKLQIESAN